ncbi:unnamed protein product, partial [Trichogramma brassicae]
CMDPARGIRTFVILINTENIHKLEDYSKVECAVLACATTTMTTSHRENLMTFAHGARNLGRSIHTSPRANEYTSQVELLLLMLLLAGAQAPPTRQAIARKFQLDIIIILATWARVHALARVYTRRQKARRRCRGVPTRHRAVTVLKLAVAGFDPGAPALTHELVAAAARRTYVYCATKARTANIESRSAIELQDSWGRAAASASLLVGSARGACALAIVRIFIMYTYISVLSRLRAATPSSSSSSYAVGRRIGELGAAAATGVHCCAEEQQQSAPHIQQQQKQQQHTVSQ